MESWFVSGFVSTIIKFFDVNKSLEDQEKIMNITIVLPQQQSQVTKLQNYQLVGKWLKIDGQLVCRWVSEYSY